METYFLHLKKQSQRDPPAPAASQVILISNNQYTTGVACPGPQQWARQ